MASSAAIRRVIDQQRHRVYTLAYYTLGSHADAEDATQETLLRYWRHANRVDPDRVEGWLVRTTTNVCVDLIRRRNRSREASGSESTETSLRSAAADTPGPDANAAEAESRRLVERELAALNEPHRSLLILREIRGLTYAQIAAELDMPLTRVRVYLHRGRRILAERLGPILGPPPASNDDSSRNPHAEAYAHDG